MAKGVTIMNISQIRAMRYRIADRNRHAFYNFYASIESDPDYHDVIINGLRYHKPWNFINFCFNPWARKNNKPIYNYTHGYTIDFTKTPIEIKSYR